MLSGILLEAIVKRQSFPSNRNIVLMLLWLAALSAAITVRLIRIDAFSGNNDEGAYLMWARLVAEGYPLYRQTVSVSAPLFIEMLALAIRWFGFSVVMARVLILVSFAATAAVMSRLSYRLAGWAGAFLALGMLAVLPHFFPLSREIMAEVPATLFAVLAVALAYRYFKQGGVLWLALAGSMLVVSGLMKALYPAAALPIGYFIIRREKNWGHIIRAGAVFGGAALATAALIVVWYPRDAFFSQAIGFREDLRAAFPLDLAGNVAFIRQKFHAIGGVWVLGGVGAVVSAKSVRGQAWLLWLVGSLAIVLWHTPLFWHHLIIVLPPLVLLNVEALNVGMIAFRRAPFSSPKRWFWMAALILPLLNIPAAVSFDQKNIEGFDSFWEMQAIDVLQPATRPGDFVVSDSLMLPLAADRLTPPPMGDIAFVAIRSGRQTSARLIAVSEQFDVQAVAVWTSRITWLPEYLDWAESNFYVRREWDATHKLYLGRRPAPGAPIPHDTRVTLDDAIAFRGFSVDAEDISAGETLPLTLYWQATQPVATDYTIFVQVLDAAGALVAQHDGKPIYGLYPTPRWQSGELIADRVDIPLPEELPAGNYTIITGMYDLDTMARLPVQNGAQDYINVTTITVK